MPQVDDMNFTELAMGSEVQQMQPGMPNKHGLYVEFYFEPEPDAQMTLEAGHPKFKEVTYIMIMTPGDKGAVIRRPIRTGQHPKHDNNRFHNEYVAFLQRGEQPLDGMPLSEWPQMTRSQVLELEHFGIKTVEHLANLTDGNAQKFMGLVTYREKARAFLESAKEAAPMQQLHAEIEHRNEELSSMQMQMKEMAEELAELKGGKRKKKSD